MLPNKDPLPSSGSHHGYLLPSLRYQAQPSSGSHHYHPNFSVSPFAATLLAPCFRQAPQARGRTAQPLPGSGSNHYCLLPSLGAKQGAARRARESPSLFPRSAPLPPPPSLRPTDPSACPAGICRHGKYQQQAGASAASWVRTFAVATEQSAFSLPSNETEGSVGPFGLVSHRPALPPSLYLYPSLCPSLPPAFPISPLRPPGAGAGRRP